MTYFDFRDTRHRKMIGHARDETMDKCGCRAGLREVKILPQGDATVHDLVLTEISPLPTSGTNGAMHDLQLLALHIRPHNVPLE